MMLITRATTNYVYPTCTEKQLLVSPSYILRFTSETTKKVRYCSATDSSPAPDRYQKLTIVETTTPTSLTNQIKLDGSRSWKYEVFEISAANLALVTDFSTVDYTTLTRVELGRARVSDSTTTSPQEYTGYQSTYNEYNG